MADAGKIMFTLKGDYDETVPYEILDVVTYDSSLYVSRINNNLGYAPSDTEKWQLLIQKSDVVGVKGDAETDYRTGLVNITPKDIGLGDLKDVAFSGDYNDLNNIPKDWENNTLNTLAEIEAATEENLIAGALAVKELSMEVSDCFQSVSDGKSLIASAITGKGVSTASNATFQTMANNIKNISSGTLKRQTIKTYSPFKNGQFTIDIKTILPNHYSSLTISNFAFANIGLNIVDATQYNVPTVSMLYSASNGILTLYSQGYTNVICEFKFTVVCYYIE